MKRQRCRLVLNKMCIRDRANAVDNSVADKAEGNGALVEYVNEILKPVNAYKGNKDVYKRQDYYCRDAKESVDTAKLVLG